MNRTIIVQKCFTGVRKLSTIEKDCRKKRETTKRVEYVLEDFDICVPDRCLKREVPQVERQRHLS